MLKLILKNLWARRRRNGWLLAELILVSIVTWIILDPVIVTTYDRSIPLGYDTDRLCLVTLSTLQPQAPGYDEEAEDSAMIMKSYFNLTRLVKDYPGVESATPVLGFAYPNSTGNANTSIRAEGDTLDLPVMIMEFIPHTNFFETYGFRSGRGRTPAELSDYDYTENDIVMTENTAEHLFHTKNAGNKRCWSREGNDTIYSPVIGVVGNFKATSDSRPAPVILRPLISIDMEDAYDDMRILLCLKENVSMKRFLHDFQPWMVKELRAGNLFARNVRSYEALITKNESYDVTPMYRRNLAMAAFFLINLCLGVIGTFWLQTRTRREEVGVMLSFGGTPGYIVRLLMGEGAVLTFVAALTGCLLYLQYAVKEGLERGNNWRQIINECWVTDFTQHFLIVSFIVFFILLAVVLIGIYIPARKIGRIPPTEALRDE